MAVPNIPQLPRYTRIGYAMTLTSTLDAGFIVQWNRNPSVPTEHYELRHSAGATLKATTADAATSVTVTTTLADAGVDFSVNAKNADGSSAGVAIGDFEPYVQTEPTEPSTVSVSDVTEDEATVSWDNGMIDTGNSHWVIELYELGALVQTVEVGWQLSSHAFTGLTPGTTYEVKVAGRLKWKVGSVPTTLTSDFADGVAFVTLPDDPEIDGEDEVRLTVGIAAAGTFRSNAGPVVEWKLAGGPAGVTAAAREDIPGNALLDLGGAPTVAGFYEATLSARTFYGGIGDHGISTKQVRFYVQGNDYVEWFDDDPSRLALQVDQRSRKIRSASFVDSALRLTRGDERRIHFIMRDGARVIDAELAELAFIVRLPGQSDGVPLLSYRSAAPTTEVIATHELCYFDVSPENDFVKYCFDRLREAAGKSQTELICEGEVVTKIAGARTRTAEPFRVILTDDYGA